MKKIETAAVVGLGAIGSACVSKLAGKLPQDALRVVAAGARAEKYRASGISVNGVPYPVHVVEPQEACAPADLVIFAVKFNQLAEVVKDAAKQVGPDTVILSLLNGIKSEEVLGEAFGPEKVLTSVITGIDAVREGTATVFHSFGYISFGEKKNAEGEYSEKVLRVKALFDHCGIPYEIPEDMLYTLWWKFMINVGVNQTSAVLGAPYGVFQKVPEARAVMIDAAREVIRVSEKAGVNLKESEVDAFLRVIDGTSPVGKTSMLQDMEAHRPTEVNIFGGTVVELGEKYGVPTPANRVLVNLIRAKEGMFALSK